MKKALRIGLLWVILPVAIPLLGLYVIGPSLSKVPGFDVQARKMADMAQDAKDAVSGGKKEPEPEPAPQPKFSVDVEGEVTRSRAKNRDADVETLTPGRLKDGSSPERDPMSDPDQERPARADRTKDAAVVDQDAARPEEAPVPSEKPKRKRKTSPRRHVPAKPAEDPGSTPGGDGQTPATPGPAEPAEPSASPE